MHPRSAESGERGRPGSGTPSGPPTARGSVTRVSPVAGWPPGGAVPHAAALLGGVPQPSRTVPQPSCGRPWTTGVNGGGRRQVAAAGSSGRPAGRGRPERRPTAVPQTPVNSRERPGTREGPGVQRSRWSPGPSPRVAGQGFEPWKAKPTDLQSAPIGRSGNLPGLRRRVRRGASPRIADDPPEPEIGCSGAPRPGTSGTPSGARLSSEDRPRGTRRGPTRTHAGVHGRPRPMRPNGV